MMSNTTSAASECRTCKGKGMSMGCPICGKLLVKSGRTKKKLNADFEIAREEKRQATRDEIAALWEQATLAQWNKDRRKYIEIMTTIRRKENLFLIKED